MYGDPELWHALMGRLAAIAIAFLQVQVEAGASAVQLFDSWVGVVSPEDYRHAILPHTQRIFAALAAVGRAEDPLRRRHRRAARPARRGRRGRGRRRLADPARRGAPAGSAAGKALQGNLDPSVLLAPWDVVEPRARAILDRGRTLPRPHLQPRPRRPPGDRPRHAGPARRPRPRGLRRPRLTVKKIKIRLSNGPWFPSVRQARCRPRGKRTASGNLVPFRRRRDVPLLAHVVQLRPLADDGAVPPNGQPWTLDAVVTATTRPTAASSPAHATPAELRKLFKINVPGPRSQRLECQTRARK